MKDITAKSILPLIKKIAYHSQVVVDGDYGFKIKSSNTQQVLTKIIEDLSKNNIKIESIAIKSPSLEEVFLNMVNDTNNIK